MRIQNGNIARNRYLSSRLGTALLCIIGIGPQPVNAAIQAPTAKVPPAPKPPQRTYNEAYDPQKQKAIRTETTEFVLSLTRKEACQGCLSGVSFSFEVTSKQDGRAWQFSIANLTMQVDEAHIVSETRAVVIGRTAASVVTVVDFTRGAVVDSFLCYRPAVSPDNRFVAYVKFYPQHNGLRVLDERPVPCLRLDRCTGRKQDARE